MSSYPSERRRPIVLTFLACYLPGYKSGGPVRTIANMVDQLGDEFAFRIVTRDRDRGDAEPYSTIEVGKWNSVGKAEVLHLPPEQQKLRSVAGILRRVPHEVLYLNSFFDPVFTIYPLLARRVGLAPSNNTIVAPRGEFSRGALELKWIKKNAYIHGARLAELYRDVVWQASSEHEIEDIRRVMRGEGRRACVAPNMPSSAKNGFIATHSVEKETGDELEVLSLSRITPMKNLKYALGVLRQVNVPVRFDIYGPVADKDYFNRCQRVVEQLPSHVRVRYCGEVPHEEVVSRMVEADLFFLPTRGENYGHVVAEAISAGTPVLISDQTPWRNLEAKGVGWDLPLSDEGRFVQAIEAIHRMPIEERQLWRSRIRRFAREVLGGSEAREANRRLLMQAASGSARVTSRSNG